MSATPSLQAPAQTSVAPVRQSEHPPFVGIIPKNQVLKASSFHAKKHRPEGRKASNAVRNITFRMAKDDVSQTERMPFAMPDAADCRLSGHEKTGDRHPFASVTQAFGPKKGAKSPLTRLSENARKASRRLPQGLWHLFSGTFCQINKEERHVSPPFLNPRETEKQKNKHVLPPGIEPGSKV